MKKDRRIGTWAMNIKGYKPEEEEMISFMRETRKERLIYQNEKRTTMNASIEVALKERKKACGRNN